MFLAARAVGERNKEIRNIQGWTVKIVENKGKYRELYGEDGKCKKKGKKGIKRKMLK